MSETVTYKYYLKGGVQTSVDENGVITKTTTWIVEDTTADHNPDPKDTQNPPFPRNTPYPYFLHWLEFEETVKTWAGDIGDPWKKPLQSANDPEVTSYTEDDTFVVQNIAYAIAPGRTHYEVTFTNVQNDKTVKTLGVDLTVDQNGQKTKTATYRINLNSGTIGTLDGIGGVDGIGDTSLFLVGGTVTWEDKYGDSDTYLVDNVSCSHQSTSGYNVTVTARDVSKMMMGAPVYGEDNFKQKTVSVTWRLSKDAYEDLFKGNLSSGQTPYPVIGEPIGAWLSDSNGVVLDDAANYIVSGISANPDNRYSYTLKIDAKHVSKRFVKQSQETKWNANGFNEHNKTTTYQSDEVGLLDFANKVGLDAYTPGMTTTRIAIAPQGVNDYEITVEETDNARPNYGSDGTPEALGKQVQIQTSLGEFQLTYDMIGFASTISNIGYYQINFPPRTTRYERISKGMLNDTNNIYGTLNQWTDAQIVAALNADKPMIGLSWISSITFTDSNNEEKTLPLYAYKQRGLNTVANAKKIDTINVLSYVYAQPGMPIFRKWDANYRCPLYCKEIPWKEGLDGNRYHLGMFIGCRTIPVYDMNITMNYKGNVPTILRKDPMYYFEKAVNEVDNQTLFSYRFENINYNSLKDNNGRDWTAVSIGMRVLTKAWKNLKITRGMPEGLYYLVYGWNPNYVSEGGDRSYVITR